MWKSKTQAYRRSKSGLLKAQQGFVIKGQRLCCFLLVQFSPSAIRTDTRVLLSWKLLHQQIELLCARRLQRTAQICWRAYEISVCIWKGLAALERYKVERSISWSSVLFCLECSKQQVWAPWRQFPTSPFSCQTTQDSLCAANTPPLSQGHLIGSDHCPFPCPTAHPALPGLPSSLQAASALSP